MNNRVQNWLISIVWIVVFGAIYASLFYIFFGLPKLHPVFQEWLHPLIKEHVVLVEEHVKTDELDKPTKSVPQLTERGMFSEKIAIPLFVGLAAVCVFGWGIHQLLLQSKALTEQIKNERKRVAADILNKAIEHLGATDHAVVLGGIYALNDLARTYEVEPDKNDKYSKTVSEILCSYIREETSKEVYRVKACKLYEKRKLTEHLQKTEEYRDQKQRQAARQLKQQQTSSDTSKWVIQENLEIDTLDIVFGAEVAALKKVFDEKEKKKAPSLNIIQTIINGLFRRKGRDMYNRHYKCPDETANLKGAFLRKMDFKKANLANVRLHGADLLGVNLKSANLQKTDFREAKLQGARFDQADKEESNKEKYGADLRGANLKDANLMGACLRKAVFSQKTILEGAKMHGVYCCDVDGFEKFCTSSKTEDERCTTELLPDFSDIYFDDGDELLPLEKAHLVEMPPGGWLAWFADKKAEISNMPMSAAKGAKNDSQMITAYQLLKALKLARLNIADSPLGDDEEDDDPITITQE